jgi:glycogen synthase
VPVLLVPALLQSLLQVVAMMNGTPVIAQKSGGVLETIVEGKTGVFFDDFTIESLNNAIKKFEKILRPLKPYVKKMVGHF